MNIIIYSKMKAEKLIEKNELQSASEEKNKSKKRKYSSRMRQLAPNQTSLVSTYHYQTESPPQESARARNNVASQTSRARRKIYMHLLEQQVTNLELELEETNHAIDAFRTQIFNALMHTDQVNSEGAEIQSHVLKKLKGLLQQEKSPKRDSQINICLDSCIYRIGASGSERKAILDILYAGMINRTLPNIYRYLLWSAANYTHLFQQPEVKRSHEVWWNQIRDVGEVVIQKNQELLLERGQPLGVKARQILRCSRQILQKKQQIQRYGQSYQKVLKELRKILSPVQFTELFLFAQRSVHKRELELLPQEEEVQQQLSKRVKLNQQLQ